MDFAVKGSYNPFVLGWIWAWAVGQILHLPVGSEQVAIQRSASSLDSTSFAKDIT